jgi:hypothetical protein
MASKLNDKNIWTAQFHIMKYEEGILPHLYDDMNEKIIIYAWGWAQLQKTKILLKKQTCYFHWAVPGLSLLEEPNTHFSTLRLRSSVLLFFF